MLEQEIENTVMPAEYRDKKISILCNDCSEKSEVPFHILGAKCLSCNSYNTRLLWVITINNMSDKTDFSNVRSDLPIKKETPDAF